jgi:hypothetical protein
MAIAKMKQYSQVSYEGQQGMGKSQKQLLDMFTAYQDWDKALKYTYCFFLSPAIKAMKEARASGKKIPIVNLDDIGVTYGRFSQWRKGGMKIGGAIERLLILARECTYGLLFSSPHEDIMAIFRRHITHKVELKWYKALKVGGYFISFNHPKDRVAIVYAKKRRPDGTPYPKKIIIEAFRVDRTVPRDVLEDYYAKRFETATPILDQIETEIETFEEQLVKEIEAQPSQEQEETLMEKALELRQRGLPYWRIALELFGDGKKEREAKILVAKAQKSLE